MDILPERIKNKVEITKIYSTGKTIISTDKKIKASYLLSSCSDRLKIKYAVNLSSKTGNSVWRNKFKRLIRESVRAELDLLREIIFLSKSSLSIIFASGSITQRSNTRIFLHDIKPSVLDILYKLRKVLEKEQKVIMTTGKDIQVDTR